MTRAVLWIDRPSPGSVHSSSDAGSIGGSRPLEHAPVALQQRGLVAVAGQAALDALDAHAAASARTPATGSRPRRLAEQDRDRARAQQVARRRRARDVGSPRARRSASASSPSRANIGDVRVHPIAEQRVAHLDQHRLVRRRRLAPPPERRRRRPTSPTRSSGRAGPSRARRRPPARMASPAARIDEHHALEHARGTQRLEVVEQDRAVRDGEEVLRPVGRRRPRAIVASAPGQDQGLRNLHTHQRTSKAITSAAIARPGMKNGGARRRLHADRRAARKRRCARPVSRT